MIVIVNVLAAVDGLILTLEQTDLRSSEKADALTNKNIYSEILLSAKIQTNTQCELSLNLPEEPEEICRVVVHQTLGFQGQHVVRYLL